MKFTENRKVENTYRENPDLDKALRYRGMNLYADQKPYALVLTKEDGSVFGEIPVDFYFDAVAIHEDVLYVGLRDGEVLKCSLDPCRVESKFFLSLEVWQSLFDHESIIEGTRQVVKRHELGRKENMAMANILNDHCFESAVTRIAVVFPPWITALSIRFCITCWISTGSIGTKSGSSGTETETATPGLRLRKASTAAPSTSSSGSSCLWRSAALSAPMRVTESRFSTMRQSQSASCRAPCSR